MNKRRRLATVLAGACLIAGSIGTGMAIADPSGSPQYRDLAGVGSDTTEGVGNGLAAAVTVNGVRVIGSYDATGSATITTKDPVAKPACKDLARPNGSGAGRTALINSQVAGNGCIDFARSSSLNLTAAPVGLTYVPMATDGLTYAVASSSTVPRKLTMAQLQAIYHCDPAFVGTAPNYAINPYLPQSGSGTRSFWMSTMGITETQITNGQYPCLKDKAGGVPVQEHDGRFLGNKDLVPFSIAQYQAQAGGTMNDFRGSALLGSIDGISPTTLNSDFTVKRDVYNVIPTAKEGTAPWSTTFVGPGSLVCQQRAVIQRYGFALSPECGSTAKRTS
ncbi:hypothetical protein ACFQLX_17235 [Streptomyces polyrhachis]|uniref:PBP domain-containing protein n=1 Tax=Streptomyces polyrhachis TaxID=1282885 RepID=A0ABW2GGK2_9ACTN